VDRGMGTLLAELKDRGLLDSTLVVWMGEFGRTPRVNRGGGRDHYSKAWTTVLAGGGIRGGQVVGKTDGDAASVTDRPITAPGFMATLCKGPRIAHTHTSDTPRPRPVQDLDEAT